jgi:transcriptional regulator with PAS, ATPase and Fis domain
MNRKDMIQGKFDDLRRQAEVLMAKKGFVSPSVIDHDPLELINELQTFQVELELQDEEFQRSQQELMEFKARYTELYGFTPVGYVCLNIKGVILNANLTLADMLSLERSSMIDEKKARQLGISAYMMKPLSILKIAKTIRKLMGQKKKTPNFLAKKPGTSLPSKLAEP